MLLLKGITFEYIFYNQQREQVPKNNNLKEQHISKTP